MWEHSFCVKVILELEHICQLVKDCVLVSQPLTGGSGSCCLHPPRQDVPFPQTSIFRWSKKLFSTKIATTHPVQSNLHETASVLLLSLTARTLWRSYICAVMKTEPEYSECVNKTGISPLYTQMYCFTGNRISPQYLTASLSAPHTWPFSKSPAATAQRTPSKSCSRNDGSSNNRYKIHKETCRCIETTCKILLNLQTWT